MECNEPDTKGKDWVEWKRLWLEWRTSLMMVTLLAIFSQLFSSFMSSWIYCKSSRKYQRNISNSTAMWWRMKRNALRKVLRKYHEREEGERRKLSLVYPESWCQQQWKLSKNGKGMFLYNYIVQYPVHWTDKALYTSTPWHTCSFRHQHDLSGNNFSHTAITRKYHSFTSTTLSIARYTFIQLSELGRHGQNENAQTSKR